jgi:hypothetical protein
MVASADDVLGLASVEANEQLARAGAHYYIAAA